MPILCVANFVTGGHYRLANPDHLFVFARDNLGIG